jgi:hypothetical protein
MTSAAIAGTTGPAASSPPPETRRATVWNTAVFVSIFLLTLFIMAMAQYSLARLVDPYGEYGTGKFPVIVMDSRNSKMHLFEEHAIHPPARALIFGSSRSLLLRPSQVASMTGENTFNFAVDNAHTEDFLAIYHWARHQGVHPRTLIVGVDVVGLHSDNLPDHMFQRINALRDSLSTDRTGSPFGKAVSSTVEALKRPFTVDYLKDSVKSILIAMRHTEPSRGFDADGFLNGGHTGVPFPDAVIDAQHSFKDDLVTYKERFEGMDGLSPKRCGYLNSLIEETQADGGRVIVWLTPVHPKLMEALRDTRYPQLVELTQAYLEDLHRRYGVAAYDLSDLRSFNGSESNWDDGTHMGSVNSGLVLQRILGGTR